MYAHALCFCRFFPAVYYLSTSKIAIAVLGNLAFAMALTLYNLTTKVGICGQGCHACSVWRLTAEGSAGVSWHVEGVRG